MAKQTHRPYVPFGTGYKTKKAATEAAKQMPWPCVPCKGGNGYALVRKDKKR